MVVHFRKTGARRYGVLVERESAPAVVAHPAPGYDDFLPHDLLHFVGEAEWGLEGAVFGQLAAGGDPGIFVPAEQERVGKAMRQRRLRARRKRRIAPRRGNRSELIAGVLERAWDARRGRGRLPDDWDELLAAARVEREHLDAVVASLDDLAERWHALRVGESLTLEWPKPERRRNPRSRLARQAPPVRRPLPKGRVEG